MTVCMLHHFGIGALKIAHKTISGILQECASTKHSALSTWLQENDLSEYQGAFSRAGIGVDMLALLGDEELRQMGIAALGPRRRILAAIQASKPLQVGILLYLMGAMSVHQLFSTKLQALQHAAALKGWSECTAHTLCLTAYQHYY